MKESFVFLAEGFEEIEALTAIDVMRRAGMPVKTVSITSALQVCGAHGVTVNADVIFDNTLFKDPAWLVLPGGMPGATNLYNFAPLQGLLRRQASSADGRIAAICASPAVVLGRLGLLKGRKATCYPGFEEMLEGAEPDTAPVVTDDKFVLGNGPANSLLWALSIVNEEVGAHKANEVANGMLLYPAKSAAECYFG
ncbi:MAG: DJ-1/PfpI family protein [Muribaculaceae bacterium]|nr:DJ-1/PfpI family protein [Muribaculaceae bacterium]